MRKREYHKINHEKSCVRNPSHRKIWKNNIQIIFYGKNSNGEVFFFSSLYSHFSSLLKIFRVKVWKDYVLLQLLITKKWIQT